MSHTRIAVYVTFAIDVLLVCGCGSMSAPKDSHCPEWHILRDLIWEDITKRNLPGANNDMFPERSETVKERLLKANEQESEDFQPVTVSVFTYRDYSPNESGRVVVMAEYSHKYHWYQYVCIRMNPHVERRLGPYLLSDPNYSTQWYMRDYYDWLEDHWRKLGYEGKE